MLGTDIPTILTIHAVSVQIGVHHGVIAHAALTGKILPDARSGTGLPMFNAERLEEIEKALKQTRTQNG